MRRNHSGRAATRYRGVSPRPVRPDSFPRSQPTQQGHQKRVRSPPYTGRCSRRALRAWLSNRSFLCESARPFGAAFAEQQVEIDLNRAGHHSHRPSRETTVRPVIGLMMIARLAPSVDEPCAQVADRGVGVGADQHRACVLGRHWKANGAHSAARRPMANRILDVMRVEGLRRSASATCPPSWPARSVATQVGGRMEASCLAHASSKAAGSRRWRSFARPLPARLNEPVETLQFGQHPRSGGRDTIACCASSVTPNQSRCCTQQAEHLRAQRRPKNSARNRLRKGLGWWYCRCRGMRLAPVETGCRRCRSSRRARF